MHCSPAGPWYQSDPGPAGVASSRSGESEASSGGAGGAGALGSAVGCTESGAELAPLRALRLAPMRALELLAWLEKAPSASTGAGRRAAAAAPVSATSAVATRALRV